MNTSETGYHLIKYFEGTGTKISVLSKYFAYKCPAGIWTIGWGTIIYPDGTPVRKGDFCTFEQAQGWLEWEVRKVETTVRRLFPGPLLQCQFDSLVSFGYNVGTGEKGLGGSTLRKRILSGSQPDAIDEAFMMWRKANGEHDGRDNDGDGQVDEPGEKQTLAGLIRRRKSEAWLYRYGKLKFFEG